MEAGDPRVIYHAWQGSRGIVSCTAHRRRAAVSTGLPGRISNPKNSCFCDRLSIVTVEVVLLNNYTLPNYERSFLKCTPQNTIYANAQFITFEMNSLSLVILTSNRFNNIAQSVCIFLTNWSKNWSSWNECLMKVICSEDEQEYKFEISHEWMLRMIKLHIFVPFFCDNRQIQFVANWGLMLDLDGVKPSKWAFMWEISHCLLAVWLRSSIHWHHSCPTGQMWVRSGLR